MLPSQAIAELQKIIDEHGDEEELLCCTGDGEVHQITSFKFETVEDDIYPEDYNMPVGTKYIEVRIFD